MSDDEMTTHEVLVKARNLIGEEDRWCKGAWNSSNPSAPKCAIGAVWAVTSDDDVSWHAETVLRKYLPEAARDCVERFNDEPSTTYTDVIALFDCAIAATAPTPDTSWLRALVPRPAEATA